MITMKLKPFLKTVSPFNDRSDMPILLFVLKIVLAFFLCKYAGELLAEGVVILIHFAVGKNPLRGEMFSPTTITLITYYGYLIVIGITLLYWKLFQKKPLSSMGITKRFGDYFVGAAVGVLLVAASVFAILLAGAIKFHGVFKRIDLVTLLLMLGGFVVQGATEELLCRGLVLFPLKEKASLPVAIGISTLLFIIPHLPTLWAGKPQFVLVGILNLALISVVFCLLTLRLESVWAACGLHSIWNFVLYNILGLNLSGKDTRIAAVFDVRSVGANLLNGGKYGIEASLLAAAVLAVVLVLMILFPWKRKKDRSRPLDTDQEMGE